VNRTDLPEVSDDELQAYLAQAKPYTVLLLRPGPRYDPPGPGRSDAVATTILRHGKHNYAMRQAGMMPIICPFSVSTGLAGMAILTLAPAETEAMMREDEAIQQGILTYEVYETRSFPGSSLP
jgi:hypothetical protein